MLKVEDFEQICYGDGGMTDGTISCAQVVGVRRSIRDKKKAFIIAASFLDPKVQFPPLVSVFVDALLYIFLSKVSIIQQDKKTFELISNDATEDAAPPAGVVTAAHREQLNLLPPANHAAAAPCANSSVMLELCRSISSCLCCAHLELLKQPTTNLTKGRHKLSKNYPQLIRPYDSLPSNLFT